MLLLNKSYYDYTWDLWVHKYCAHSFAIGFISLKRY